MATIEAKRLNRQTYNAEHGNMCIAWGQLDVGAANGDEVLFCELPAGTRVTRVRYVNDAMGAGSQIALGYKFKDPTLGAAVANAFKAAAAVSSAGSATGDFHPLPVFTNDFYVTATVSGGALSAGAKLTVFVEYEFAGTI